jgi:hypothetical protein
MVGDMEEATEEVAGAIMGDTPTATAIAIAMAMAITGDTDMVGGVILTGGTTLTIPTMILITMKAMRACRCFHKRLILRQNLGNSNLLIGTSVRTQRVTTPTLRIARAVG